jgi:hypothetical protein
MLYSTTLPEIKTSVLFHLFFTLWFLLTSTFNLFSSLTFHGAYQKLHSLYPEFIFDQFYDIPQRKEDLSLLTNVINPCLGRSLYGELSL